MLPYYLSFPFIIFIPCPIQNCRSSVAQLCVLFNCRACKISSRQWSIIMYIYVALTLRGGGGGVINYEIDITVFAKEQYRNTEGKTLNVTRIMIIHNENGDHDDSRDYDKRWFFCFCLNLHKTWIHALVNRDWSLTFRLLNFTSNVTNTNI